MAVTPQFLTAGFTILDTIDEVNGDRTLATGNNNLLLTTSANGSELWGLRITALTSTENCMILLYADDATKIYPLFPAIVVPQNTISPNTQPWSIFWKPADGKIVFPAVATDIRAILTGGAGQVFGVCAYGGNY